MSRRYRLLVLTLFKQRAQCRLISLLSL